VAPVITTSDYHSRIQLIFYNLYSLQVIITLKMHQIRCVLEGKMPPDLSHTIVFTTSGLKRLRKRIDDLEIEKDELRQDQKSLRRYICIVLQCDVECCSAFQCNAVRCNVLQLQFVVAVSQIEKDDLRKSQQSRRLKVAALVHLHGVAL